MLSHSLPLNQIHISSGPEEWRILFQYLLFQKVENIRLLEPAEPQITLWLHYFFTYKDPWQHEIFKNLSLCTTKNEGRQQLND